MMGKMRDLTKWILYILIIAFVALMVVEWGADYSGLMQRGQSVIGEVDGREISWQEFAEAVRNARALEEQRTGENLTDEEVDQLRNRVWDDLIQRIILQRQIEKLNVKVTNDDVTNYLLTLLTQQYQSDPNFQTDGKFDQEKLNQVLANPENKYQLLNMELQAAAELPYTKLVNLINSSIIVTEQEIRDEFKQKNLKAKIDFLGVPVSAFSNDSLEVTESEMKAYYNENKDDFKVDKRVKLKYITFSLTPTSEDTARIYERIESIKAEARSGKDFEELAVLESEDPSVSQNRGDLGYFDRKTMVKEFADAAFSAEPGQIVGPVKTQFGLHIIKVIDKKMEDGVEKVRAAHILKKFEPSYTTIDNAQRQSNNFVALLEDSEFEAAADQMGLQISETAEFTKNRAGQIPGLGRIQSAVIWAFDNPKGSTSDVFYTDDAYYVFKIAEVKPEGFRPFEDVTSVLNTRVENEKRQQLAREYARQYANQAQTSGDFQKIAARDEKDILTADTTGYFAQRVFVPKIGRAPAVVAKAFSLPLNTVSGLLEADRGYYFIRVTGRTEFDEEAYAKEKSAIRNRLMQQKLRTVFNQWYEKLKEDTDIVDNRYRFYRS